MPIAAPVLAGLIGAGSSLLGQGINAAVQGRMNKKTMQYNDMVYARQRQDALADYAMQNAYNHPSSQMARLREAGLNPNLVYGNGTQTQSAQVRNTEAKQWNPQTPQFDLNTPVMGFYDMQVKQAQIDNLRTQNTVLKNDALLKLANTLRTQTDADLKKVQTDVGKLDLKKNTALFDTTIAQAIANLKKTEADTQFTIDENTRKALMFSPSLEKAIEEVKTQKARTGLTQAQINLANQNIAILKKSGVLKDIEISWARKGIVKTDSPWFRAGSNLIDMIFGPKTITPDDIKTFENMFNIDVPDSIDFSKPRR